jgi:hypothetical protein
VAKYRQVLRDSLLQKAQHQCFCKAQVESAWQQALVKRSLQRASLRDGLRADGLAWWAGKQGKR